MKIDWKMWENFKYTINSQDRRERRCNLHTSTTNHGNKNKIIQEMYCAVWKVLNAQFLFSLRNSLVVRILMSIYFNGTHLTSFSIDLNSFFFRSNYVLKLNCVYCVPIIFRWQNWVNLRRYLTSWIKITMTSKKVFILS